MEELTFAVRADVGEWTPALAERAEQLGLDVHRVFAPKPDLFGAPPKDTTDVTFVVEAPSLARAEAAVIRLLHAPSIVCSAAIPRPQEWERIPAPASV